MRFFVCENYKYDTPKYYGKDRPKVLHHTLWFLHLWIWYWLLTWHEQRLYHLYLISYGGRIPSNRSMLRTSLNAKQGGQQKGVIECCFRNSKRRSAMKRNKRSGRGWRRWNVRRWRDLKLTTRGNERGRVVPMKQRPANRKEKYLWYTQQSNTM